jgi:hypothetical protein
MRVTWASSGRIHRTADGKKTVCGHDISQYTPYRTTKKEKCKTCFTKKEHHKEPFFVRGE